MLSAMNRFDVQVVAWEANKEDGPFSCPECKKGVVIKKGDAIMHHFAHVPPSTCNYGSGETVEHWQAKLEVYKALQKHPGVTELMLERYLDGARPDISFYLREIFVAIEIQRSTQSVRKINQRTQTLTEKNLCVLWLVLRAEKISASLVEEIEEQRYAPLRWEKHLHTMYYGKVFYWLRDETILPVHFGEYIVGRTYRRWFDKDTGEWIDGYRSKRYRTPTPHKEVKITDLIAKQRDFWMSGTTVIPAACLWGL